ncbi:MAG: ring-opening amidohydrolase [Defluviicoccus sp.]|nr:ring-opening amidohydrolase [Defluviicoccus sp.]MDE0275181.1 ring-opening amidohydrolase [Defluviicoccus sp.]
MRVHVDAYATEGPGDVAGLERILSGLPTGDIARLALVAKTEGTATINDFSRELALSSAERTIERIGGADLLGASTLIFSTGSEGVLSPVVYMLAAIADDSGGDAERLVIGGGRTRAMAAGELVTPTHARLIAGAVGEAMAEAGLAPDQVALVFVKSPILSHRDAAATGDPAVIARAGSSGQSRGAAALGVALALGELDDAEIDDTRIGVDLDRHSSRAMSFSGTEVEVGEVLVLGNRPGAGGSTRVYSGPMADILDARSLKDLFRRAGCALDETGEIASPERLRAVFVKAGVAPDGRVRGERTTVFHSDLDPDKHMRATASGVIGGILGTGQVFVSGGTEHQAPPGGGLCACIADAGAADG